MTSFIINSHIQRPLPESWQSDPDEQPNCPFCRIIANSLPAYKVYEDDKVIAILDILPLRTGHLLVIPKVHFSRLSDLPSDYAAATGAVVSRVARALTQALDNTGLNVVCNQEYAQAVPHVHYHIIPAPKIGAAPLQSPEHNTPLSRKEMHRKEFESRQQLDEEEAEALALNIRARL